MKRAFPGRGSAVRSQYTRAGMWLRAAVYGDESAAKWCGENRVVVQRATGETTGSSGAWLVPADLANAILDLRDSYGAFRRRARIVPMASDSTVVARHPGGTAAYFIGENTAATESTANPDAITLTAKKIATLIRLSAELQSDAITAGGILVGNNQMVVPQRDTILDGAVDYVANEIALAFAAKEDDCAFNGDGTSAYGKMRGISGLVFDGSHTKANVAAASGHNTFLTIDSTDLANLLSAVQASAIPNAAWFCSQTCFAQTFCRLAGGTGYLPMAMTDGVMTPHYLGFPVILTQKLPLVTTTLAGKVMLAFGDMNLAGVLGERRGFTIAVSAERFFDQNQIAVLGTERFHTVVHDMGDNANFGAVAALVGTT